MAAAEARAAWQRTANRYFVQEDAKRAPKLSYCSSASSLLSKQVDMTPESSTDADDSNFLFPNEKSSYSYLSSDSKWWLKMQPDYMYQRGLTNEQVNALEAQNPHQFVENQDFSGSVVSFLKESYEFVEIESVDCCKRYKNLSYEFNMDPKVKHLMGIEQTCELPWWQMTEKDRLAPDLGFDVLGLKPQRIKCQNVISRVEVQPVTSKLISPLSIGSHENTFHQAPREKAIDLSKTKILEALSHSQTRAREAENAAKEAHAEKEHVLKILFRQASQLFAYRQWIYLLQLENLYYQIKNSKNEPVSPDYHSETGNLDSKTTPAKGKTRSRHGFDRYEHNVGRNAVVFVVGLGIVGAGLLLGWTIGWLLM